MFGFVTFVHPETVKLILANNPDTGGAYGSFGKIVFVPIVTGFSD